MPLEAPTWDRKEYFKARKEGRSEEFLELKLTRCGSGEARKRPDYGALFKSSSLDHEHSWSSGKMLEDVSAIQLSKKLCCSIALHENCNRNSQVFGCPVDLKLDNSAYVLPERLWDASCSDLVCVSSSRVELPKQYLKLCQSASGDIVTCVTPTTPTEEASPWKKPRLRWGEGLAKFEKKSAGSDDGRSKSETISCLSAQISDCASPSTPSSAACSSHPGFEVKPSIRGVVVDNGKGHSQTLVSESQKHLESFPICLEKLDLSVITHAVSSLVAMLNFDNQCSEDTSSASCSVLSKLTLLKSEILKVMDMTESQVGLLESELKSNNNKSEPNDCRCSVSDRGASEMPVRPASPSHASANTFVVKVPVDSGNSEGVKAGMDSPGTVTSKLIELPPITEPHVENGKISDGDCIFRLNDSHFAQEYQKISKVTSNAGKMSDVFINGVLESNNSGLASSISELLRATDDRLINSIWDSNREYANKASSDFDVVFPVAGKVEDISYGLCSKDSSLREFIVRKKKALRFKEQAVTLKWRALNSIWKNDMRLLSVRNHRSKAQRQCEILSRTAQNHPSVRSNVIHVKKSGLDMGKLLSNSYLKPCQSVLKMPALILDDDERRMSRFLSKNGLVEDPWAVEKERSMMNAWTSEEKDIFMDKLTSHGKDFRKIASFLDLKTIADCVEFYYKNHKSVSFARTLKRRDQRVPVKSLTCNTYLITPAKKWDRDMDTAALEILGAASELASRNGESKGNKRRGPCGVRVCGVACTKPLEDCHFPDMPSNSRLAENVTGTADNGILPGACCSVSSEALSSCITGSVSLGEGHHNGTLKTFSIISEPLTIAEDMQIDDEETCSDESSCELDVGFWTDREKSVFVRAVKSYGKDFCMISRCIRTKSKDQCKSFYSKARKCLGLDIVHPDNDHEQQSVINDRNGDGSPTLTSTPEAVLDTGSYKVSQRIVEDMSLSLSVTSNVDLLSPDAGMTFHACPDKLKDKEGDSEKLSADPKVEGQSVDKFFPNLDPVCLWGKSTVPTDINKQGFPIQVSESANKSVDISPSLSFILPSTSAQVEKERGPVEPPFLHNQGGVNGTSSGSFQDKISYINEDHGKPKAPGRAPVRFTYPVSPQMVMYNYKGSARHQNSLDRLADLASHELSNSTPTAALPTPDISFAKNSLVETLGHFRRSHCVSNRLSYRAHTLSNQFYASQDFKQGGEKAGSGWNLNFKDSTVSKGSYSDSENGLPSYASIPPTSYIMKYNSLNSNCSVTELPSFKHSSHQSRNKTINSDGPEKQGNQANLKLFGQVLIPSNAQEPHKLTQLAQMNGTRVDTKPSNHHVVPLGSENLPARSFWDGHQVETVPFLPGCPIPTPLPHDMSSSSSILDRQPHQTTAVPNVNAPLYPGSLFINSLNRSLMPHFTLPSVTRPDS